MVGCVTASTTSSGAMKLMHGVTGDPTKLQQLARKGIDILKSLPATNASAIVANGYCFGGLVVLELARQAAPLAGVAGFGAGFGRGGGLPPGLHLAAFRARDAAGDELVWLVPPMPDAGHADVVKLLVDCGAHLQTIGAELGELLCDLARRGKLRQLK